jgi:hypothetical protein
MSALRRREDPPSWLTANLRSPVSLAFPCVPGRDCEPGRTDTGSAPAGKEAGQ